MQLLPFRKQFNIQKYQRYLVCCLLLCKYVLFTNFWLFALKIGSTIPIFLQFTIQIHQRHLISLFMTGKNVRLTFSISFGPENVSRSFFLCSKPLNPLVVPFFVISLLLNTLFFLFLAV